MVKSKRISITLSEEEYEKWMNSANQGNLSAFIREAVNEYIKINEPSQKKTLFDLYVQQRDDMLKIHEKLNRLEKIEGDILDITHALAKLNIITPVEHGGEFVWELKKKKI